MKKLTKWCELRTKLDNMPIETFYHDNEKDIQKELTEMLSKRESITVAGPLLVKISTVIDFLVLRNICNIELEEGGNKTVTFTEGREFFHSVKLSKKLLLLLIGDLQNIYDKMK